MSSIPHIAERVVDAAPGSTLTTATATGASFTSKTDGMARVFVRIGTTPGQLQVTSTRGTSFIGLPSAPAGDLVANAVNGPFYHPVIDGVAYTYQPVGATVVFESFTVDVTNH